MKQLRSAADGEKEGKMIAVADGVGQVSGRVINVNHEVASFIW